MSPTLGVTAADASRPVADANAASDAEQHKHRCAAIRTPDAVYLALTFKWPFHLGPVEDGQGRKLPIVELDEEQFFWLLDGLDLRHLKPHRSLEYRTVL